LPNNLNDIAKDPPLICGDIAGTMDYKTPIQNRTKLIFVMLVERCLSKAIKQGVNRVGYCVKPQLENNALTLHS